MAGENNKNEKQWWELTDSELISHYTDKKTGKINWKVIEDVRKTRDSYMITGSDQTAPRVRKRFADLESGWYDFDERVDPTYPGGKTMMKGRSYPLINQGAYMSGQKLRRSKQGNMSDKIMEMFKESDKPLY